MGESYKRGGFDSTAIEVSLTFVKFSTVHSYPKENTGITRLIYHPEFVRIAKVNKIQSSEMSR
jgi:hypothetical protein